MADMDTVELVNTLDDEGGEQIFVTLGPDGHKLSKDELLAIVRKALADENTRDVDLTF